MGRTSRIHHDKGRRDREITLEFTDARFARYVKIHSHFYEQDLEGEPLTDASELTLNETDPYEITLVSSGRNEFYAYDAAGNRLQKTFYAAGVFTTGEYEYLEGSSLIKYDGTYAYNYDEKGNMTVRGDSFDTEKTSIYQLGDYREYEYDDFNRLVKVTKLAEDETALETVAEYVYNADGYRIMKTDGEGNTTTYTFDLEGKVLEEVTADETTDYAYLGRKHLARMTDTETLYYGTDHLGSTILMTDENGEEVWTGAVTPFADEESTEGLEERVKYTGKDLDEDTGLYYFNARWYDPLNGRFITEDPVRDGLNWYVYCGNNPLKRIDASGLSWEDVVNDYGMDVIINGDGSVNYDDIDYDDPNVGENIIDSDDNGKENGNKNSKESGNELFGTVSNGTDLSEYAPQPGQFERVIGKAIKGLAMLTHGLRNGWNDPYVDPYGQVYFPGESKRIAFGETMTLLSGLVTALAANSTFSANAFIADEMDNVWSKNPLQRGVDIENALGPISKKLSNNR